jgi:RNA polymerase sigma-70 factor, ECF subfamily
MEIVNMDEVAGKIRQLYPRVLGKTLALTRSLPDAEDAVQDAALRALEAWPRSGMPDSLEAWLVTVAGNCHRDRLRRARTEAAHGDALAALHEMSPWVRVAVADPDVARGWKDELLRLLFACCHPALDAGESAALALATVVGLSTAEIAAAFGIVPRSMEQRLTRARRRLREQGDYEGPHAGDAGDRLDAVLITVHLLFNEGYWSTDDEAPIRGDLCRLAIGLGRSLYEAHPAAAEVAGLLALLLFHEARRPARLDAQGVPIPLPDQDRARWDRPAISEATAILERALATDRAGPLQTEAAISAVHCRAISAAETDWPEIAALYALLERMRPTPAVRVNRAFAVARAQGPAAGLALLDGPGVPDAAAYPYAHLVRGALLEELGRDDDAIAALQLARAQARNAHERGQIDSRIDRLRHR